MPLENGGVAAQILLPRLQKPLTHAMYLIAAGALPIWLAAIFDVDMHTSQAKKCPAVKGQGIGALDMPGIAPGDVSTLLRRGFGSVVSRGGCAGEVLLSHVASLFHGFLHRFKRARGAGHGVFHHGYGAF